MKYSICAAKMFMMILLASVLFSGCMQGTDKKDGSFDFVPDPVKLEKQEVKTLEIGDQAPDFTLPGSSGRYYSLEDFDKAKVLVVIFSCNHCPTAQAYEDRMIGIAEEYGERSVQLLVISPTSAYGLLLEECGYSDLDDSFESMKLRALEKEYNFPYLYDGDDQAVSIKYGPTATPHAFVFNKDRKLEYVGRIDDSEKPGTGNAGDLRAAIEAVLAGGHPEVKVNKAFGCSIKWSWKTAYTEKVNRDWEAREVELIEIDSEGIAELKKNDSQNLLLINIWATWCAPCVLEYPDLVNLQRMYGGRAFQFVSISADAPGKSQNAHDFLKSKHSALDNYIFDSDDKYAMIEAVDSAWNGALPYTLLIEPGGKVIYSVQGVLDVFELKKTIVEHPLIGRYY